MVRLCNALLLLYSDALLFLPLPQHFPLEASHRVEQVVGLQLRGRQHHATIQETVDGRQQVLPVVCLVGRLVEVLGETVRAVALCSLGPVQNTT